MIELLKLELLNVRRRVTCHSQVWNVVGTVTTVTLWSHHSFIFKYVAQRRLTPPMNSGEKQEAEMTIRANMKVNSKDDYTTKLSQDVPPLKLLQHKRSFQVLLVKLVVTTFTNVEKVWFTDAKKESNQNWKWRKMMGEERERKRKIKRKEMRRNRREGERGGKTGSLAVFLNLY